MFTTSPWAVYVYTAGPVIAGYYLFAIAKFYSKEIKARINSRAGFSRKQTNRKAAHYDREQEVESVLIQDPSEPELIHQPDLKDPDKNKNVPSEHHNLQAHLTELIEEAHEKDYDKQELILLLQMTIKDYLDFQGTQFQSTISQLIENKCAKYGSIHLEKKDTEAIWDRV